MQDLTPLEIQKQTFSKKFKGYEPAEVHGYLNLVAEEIERLVNNEILHNRTVETQIEPLVVAATLHS